MITVWYPYQNWNIPTDISSMMMSSNGNLVGNSPVTGEVPSQRPVTRSFDVSLICALNTRLSKQSWGWSFETPSRSLWSYFNVLSWWVTLQHPTRLHNVKQKTRVPWAHLLSNAAIDFSELNSKKYVFYQRTPSLLLHLFGCVFNFI